MTFTPFAFIGAWVVLTMPALAQRAEIAIPAAAIANPNAGQVVGQPQRNGAPATPPS
jgi:hypothetical protein